MKTFWNWETFSKMNCKQKKKRARFAIFWHSTISDWCVDINFTINIKVAQTSNSRVFVKNLFDSNSKRFINIWHLSRVSTFNSSMIDFQWPYSGCGGVSQTFWSLNSSQFKSKRNTQNLSFLVNLSDDLVFVRLRKWNSKIMILCHVLQKRIWVKHPSLWLIGNYNDY